MTTNESNGSVNDDEASKCVTCGRVVGPGLESMHEMLRGHLFVKAEETEGAKEGLGVGEPVRCSVAGG